MYSTAIISSNPESGAALEVCLNQTGLVGSVRHWSATGDRSHIVEQWPDFVVLNLSRDQEPVLSQISALTTQRPGLLVLAWTSDESPRAELLISSMRSGVKDFLPARLEPTAFKEALSKRIREAGIKGSGENSKLVAVMGVKGGAGTTTVAVNIGVQLAKLTSKRVRLLDFARPLGHVSLFLDLQPRFSISDSVENLERLDTHLFEGLLTGHKSGLSVLAGTSRADDWLRLPVSALGRVANVAKSSSEFVVVDLSLAFPHSWSSVLLQADKMVLVTGADPASLLNLERHVTALEDLGIASNRLHVVANRWHRHEDEVLTNFQKKTGCRIIARLPNDFKQVSDAITLGAPLSKNHGDPLGARFRALACDLAGIPHPVEPQKKRNAFVSLFSLGS